jgi:hypothetical protein
MALLPGSPAIDKGDDSFATPTDQRGLARNAASDIGACEFIPPQIIDPTTTNNVFRFDVVADVGPKYYVEYADNVSATNWNGGTSNPHFATNHRFEVTEPGCSLNSNRFFRIRAEL